MLVTLKGQTVKDKRKASVHVCFPNRSTSSYHILRLKKVSLYRDISVFGIQNEMIYCISDISR